LKVHLCGVRGSTPATGIDFVRYGGDTLCLALAHDGAPAPTLVLDAGTGLKSVTGLLGGAPFTGTILLSHLHWDHVLGLPFFSAADRSDANVTVMLPEQQNGDGAATVLTGVMSPPYFPIRPTELRGEWSFGTVAPGEQQIQGFTVLAREIPHKGGRTFGYRVSDGHSALAYLPDHCPTEMGPGEDGFGEYHPAALELAHDADVLVHDAQLFPEELSAEAVYGHALADYAVELSLRAGARSVVLIHHRHTRTDDALDGLARRFSGPSPNVTVAVQGTTLEL
jgi:ribonuclease BN (tRNA processing enzyme)